MSRRGAVRARGGVGGIGRFGGARGAPLWLLTALACGDTGAPSGGRWMGERTDSAGVAVIRNTGPALWTDRQAWRVVPELEIGGDETRPETLFGHVADLAAGEDGRIWVLDQQAREVRVFASDGAVLGVMAGPGDGPGEIGPMAFSLVRRADTLVVADWSQARLSRFATDGTRLSGERIPVTGAARSWWEAFPDGLWFRSLERFLGPDGRWAGRDALQRYEGEGAVTTVMTFDYAQTDVGAPNAAVVPLLVDAPSWTVLEDGGVAWAALLDERVRIHAPDGRLRALLSRDAWAGRPPTAEETAALTRLLGEKFEMLGASRDLVERLDVVAPPRLPTITALHAGPDGTLWVQRAGAAEDVHPMALNTPDPPSGWGGPTWEVFDREGRWLGSVELPPRFRLLASEGDLLYGVRRDALDVERVMRLRLERRGVP